MTKHYIYILSISSICILALFSGSANAYIDPATGSMIVQAIIAAVAAVGVSVGIFWSRVRRFFARVFGRNDEPRN